MPIVDSCVTVETHDHQYDRVPTILTVPKDCLVVSLWHDGKRVSTAPPATTCLEVDHSIWEISGNTTPIVFDADAHTRYLEMVGTMLDAVRRGLDLVDTATQTKRV